MNHAIITLITLGIMTIFFVNEKIPLALTSMLGATFLALTGILPIDQLFSALSGSTIVLIAAMMVVGSTLFHTGIAEKISEALVKVTGTSENGILIAVVLTAIIISSVTSGVAVVAMLLPIVIGMCQKSNVSVSRMLIPLAFAASVGGNLTLLGAASNVVVNGQLEQLGATPLSFLEIGKVGLPISIVFTIFFLTIGKRFLTSGDSSDEEYLKAYMGQVDGTVKEYDHKRGMLSLIILGIIIIVMMWNNSRFPMHLVAATGALIMVLTNCISEKEAYKSIDMATIFIVAGMSAVSKAMDISGAGQLISDSVVKVVGDSPNKLFVLAVVFILTTLLTNIMMNTSTALLLTPIFFPIAVNIGLNPTAVAVAICVAASSPFLTPVGSGTNTLVVKPGNLGFKDFFIPGLGVTVLLTIVSLIFIPLIWPL